MLDERRKNFVTASQAHMVMAGFELEMEGRLMQRPEFPAAEAIESFIRENNKPLVSEMKSMGISVTGKEINEVYKYVKATTPVFTRGMRSVAREIAMYSFLSNRDEQAITKDMERGNIQEGEAVTALSAHLGVEFDNTTDEQVFFSDACLGVTPDAVEYNNFDIVSCGEVKNPKDTTHMRYLDSIHDQDDMLAECPDYYWQAQTGMLVTGTSRYHWASYHNGFTEKTRLVYVCVEPNTEHMEIIHERAERVLLAVPAIVKGIQMKYGLL